MRKKSEKGMRVQATHQAVDSVHQGGIGNWVINKLDNSAWRTSVTVMFADTSPSVKSEAAAMQLDTFLVEGQGWRDRGAVCGARQQGRL